MAQLIVRNLDDDVKTKLQQRAHRHGRSMEEEVRAILANALGKEHAISQPLGARLRSRFADIGLDEEIGEWRGHAAQPADLAE